MRAIHLGDNLSVLRGIPDGAFRLTYIDPPFNTGKKQERVRMSTTHDEQSGDRTGFSGKRYRTTVLGRSSYDDVFDNYLAFLEPRLREAHRVLSDDGSLFFHSDYRESHYCKVLLDTVFGRASFMNEIIWAYDYGARSKSRWPAKHDTIFWYAKDSARYVFRYSEMDRIPYMAPGLVGPKKAALGKTPTDVWWHTIVSPTGKEKTGYPTQKPLGILDRILKVHTEENDDVLDFFAGSGTTGEAAARLGRGFMLIDSNPEAVRLMADRLSRYGPTCVGFDPKAKRGDPPAAAAL